MVSSAPKPLCPLLQSCLLTTPVHRKASEELAKTLQAEENAKQKAELDRLDKEREGRQDVEWQVVKNGVKLRALCTGTEAAPKDASPAEVRPTARVDRVPRSPGRRV